MAAPVYTTILMPWLRRARQVWLKALPRAYGWCRTRWSGATLAAPWAAKPRGTVSAETLRRWRHVLDWGWKPAKLVAKDTAPQWVERLARRRFHGEHREGRAVMGCADARALHLQPTVG